MNKNHFNYSWLIELGISYGEKKQGGKYNEWGASSCVYCRDFDSLLRDGCQNQKTTDALAACVDYGGMAGQWILWGGSPVLFHERFAGNFSVYGESSHQGRHGERRRAFIFGGGGSAGHGQNSDGAAFFPVFGRGIWGSSDEDQEKEREIQNSLCSVYSRRLFPLYDRGTVKGRGIMPREGSYTIETAILMTVILWAVVVLFGAVCTFHDKAVMEGICWKVAGMEVYGIQENTALETGELDIHRLEKKSLLWRILDSHEEEEEEAVQQVEKRLEGLLFLGIKPRIEAEISREKAVLRYQMQVPRPFGFLKRWLGQIIVIQGEVPWKKIEAEELIRLCRGILQ